MLGAFRALLALGLADAALGAPGPAAAVAQPVVNSCSPTAPFLKSASGHAKPTRWCSSYLGITTPTHTRTITRTDRSTTTLTVTRGTSTVTDPTVTAPEVTDFTTVTDTADTSTFILTTCTPLKRDLEGQGDEAVKTTAAAAPAPHQNVAAGKSYPPVPSWLPNWPTSRVVTACSCLCIERPTPVQTSTIITVTPTVRRTTTVKSIITETPTITPTVTDTKTTTTTPTTTSEYCPPSVPPTCDNSGMLWAYFYNPYGNNGDYTYSQYDPVYMKNTSPVVNGNAVNAGGFSGVCPQGGGTLSFYGNDESCQLFSVMYRGYLYAPQSGNFTIKLTQADDICLIWVGDKAYSGYTRTGPNGADLDHTYLGLGSGIEYNIALSVGEYIPLRFIIAQGYGPFGFAITITAPDGTIILSSSSSGSVFLQQYPCNPVFGLPYPPWGEEQ